MNKYIILVGGRKIIVEAEGFEIDYDNRALMFNKKRSGYVNNIAFFNLDKIECFYEKEAVDEKLVTLA